MDYFMKGSLDYTEDLMMKFMEFFTEVVHRIDICTIFESSRISVVQSDAVNKGLVL